MAAHDYLVVTNKRDLTSDYIIRELEARKLSYFRLNTEAISQGKVTIDSKLACFQICIGDECIDIEGIRAAYFRRPEIPQIDPDLQYLTDRSYCVGEWSALLKSIYLQLGEKWFNHPSAILLSEDKPRQLRISASCGFNIPESLVTNDFIAARKFIASGPTVAKTLKNAVISDDGSEKVIFTNQVLELSDSEIKNLSVAPVIFQREIRKQFDVRVTEVVPKNWTVYGR